MKTSPTVLRFVAPMLVAGLVAGSAAAAQASSAEASPVAEATARASVPTPLKYQLTAGAELASVGEQLAAQGFEALELEQEGRWIEVTGLTATGHCLDLRFNAATGKEHRRKRDDDCFSD